MKIFDISSPKSAFFYNGSESISEYGARLKIIGVGGTGCHVVDHCIRRGLHGITSYIAVDTDEGTLAQSLAGTKISIPPLKMARALSPEIASTVRTVIGEADMVFMVSGLGGTAGSAISLTVAQLARESGAFTIGVVFKPQASEGKKRQEDAKEAMESLLPHVDVLVVLYGENVEHLARQSGVNLSELLTYSNELMLQTIRCISDGVMVTGLIAVDFVDICSALSRSKTAIMGIGHGVGASRAQDAALRALTNPLLNGCSIGEATGIFIEIAATSDSLTIEEIGEAAGLIQEKAHEGIPVFFNTVFYESLDNEMQVTILAAMPNVDNAKRGAVLSVTG